MHKTEKYKQSFRTDSPAPILNCTCAAALVKKETNIPNTLKGLTLTGNISESNHKAKIKL